ncbi:MAG TPA: hypothetical protein VNT51_14075, partial [Miltoncostaeaceae bacterium]|nr:hypothetical protein [Miltoncostaeaceae bacterium]
PHRPLTLRAQGTRDTCPAAPAPVAPPPAAGSGPALVVLWAGAAPPARGPAPAQGGDPESGLPAAIQPFAFPVAVPADGEVRYGAARTAVGGLHVVDVDTAPEAHVVAATDGRLAAASVAERRTGIAFWIVRSDGDRVGYGPLVSYAPGIRHGAPVATGTPLGRSVGTLAVAWTRGGTSIDPHPLLWATRPPDPATP